MKKSLIQVNYLFTIVCMLIIIVSCFQIGVKADSKPLSRVPKGVSIEYIDISGCNKEEVKKKIEEFVESANDKVVTINYSDQGKLKTTLGELEFEYIENTFVDEIFKLGTKGNVIERFKEIKDIEHEGREYQLEFKINEEILNEKIEKLAKENDIEAVNYSISRVDGDFVVKEGNKGFKIDKVQTMALVKEKIAQFATTDEIKIDSIIEEAQPKGSSEEVQNVKDLLGSFSSSFSGGDVSKVGNISHGANLINGALIYPGDEFSFDSYCAPYTVGNGFLVGKGYAAGKLVDSVGGGICQVSSTLYNAVLRAELEVTMRRNHSMIVGYVPISSDATLAYEAGIDFKFINNYEYPIYVEAYTTPENKVFVNIYGKENRSSDRTVDYVSVTNQVINPGPDIIHVDGGKLVGQFDAQSSYTGYKAELYKVVKENGVEVSRTKVNSSNYRMVPRSATFGLFTTDPSELERMNAAVATGSIDHCINVVNQIVAERAAAATPTP